jgi:inorganic pyrophosphatase
VAGDFSKLGPRNDDGTLRVVVESPRGSTLKLEYDPQLRNFSVSRSLPLGMAYPFDWGFIPGTAAEDGDPLDALAIHPDASYPGVILPCRVLGMVELDQRIKGRAEKNNRIIATPAWHEALKGVEEARDLPASVRQQLEQFFVSVAQFTGKKIRIRGWAGPQKARRFIDELTCT